MSLSLAISSKDAPWILSVIYNSQVLNDQKIIGIFCLVLLLYLQWLLEGDFNAVLFYHDFKGRILNLILLNLFFNNFINNNHLLDLGFVGSRFTWSNNQFGLAFRWARLDRFLANHDWVANFASIVNQHLLRLCYDHSLLLLTVLFSISSKKPIFLI